MIGQSQPIIEFIVISSHIIDYMDSSDPQPQNNHPSRDYKCPCGKTYLSNAAIFTHIRQKHNGIAPGEIQKPVKQGKPRGRPPLGSKKKGSQVSGNSHNSPDLNNNSLPYPEFRKLIIMLNHGLPYQQQVPGHIWDTIDTFQKYGEYVDSITQNKQKSQSSKVCIGTGLSEFMELIAKSAKPHQFQQILILFILLLQYCMDETNDDKMIENANIEEIVIYMNSFIQYHIHDYAQLLGIRQLWVMQTQNMIEIFNYLIQWLKWKGYTDWFISVMY